MLMMFVMLVVAVMLRVLVRVLVLRGLMRMLEMMSVVVLMLHDGGGVRCDWRRRGKSRRKCQAKYAH